MKIGFLGLGKMGTADGAAPARRRPRVVGVEPHRGAHRTADPRRRNRRRHAAEAELGADAVITMLFDDAAHEEVLFGPNGLMDALEPGALHIRAAPSAWRSASGSPRSTRGAGSILSPLRSLAGPTWPRRAGCGSWRPAPMPQSSARGRCSSRSRAASRWWAREPRQAHAVKLGGNFLISAMIHSLSEAFVYARVAGHRAGSIS